MTTPKPFATTSFAVSDAMTRLGRDQVAALVGVSASTLYKACNPNLPNGFAFLSWDQVKVVAAQLRAEGHPEWFSIAFDAEVAALAQQAAGGHNTNLERLAIEVAAETGDVQRAVFDALSEDSDGGSVITAAEASRAVAEIDEAMERLRMMRKRLVDCALGTDRRG
ncbi:phage regulatory CII family protein [Magnetospirillum sp. UT-4]|uniref:phage regulatory CII family protein n=1 Tax=Magnetospirillum sp. UT-4 TaxID=2681467 RepID=UPI00138404A3|nr:phage regulatory CII family protein [Magnetospirillum sp. UT-4]CAA7616556.1 hypothetical protein MTBUT4_230008 [Magnetospirillum sp. UT-4]